MVAYVCVLEEWENFNCNYLSSSTYPYEAFYHVPDIPVPIQWFYAYFEFMSISMSRLLLYSPPIFRAYYKSIFLYSLRHTLHIFFASLKYKLLETKKEQSKRSFFLKN